MCKKKENKGVKFQNKECSGRHTTGFADVGFHMRSL